MFLYKNLNYYFECINLLYGGEDPGGLHYVGGASRGPVDGSRVPEGVQSTQNSPCRGTEYTK